MNFEHNEKLPEYFHEDWDGQFRVLPWMAYITAIPHAIFMVTTLKEDGTPNAALEGWSSFTGEGENFFIIMSGIIKNSHTYQNIKRDREFCVNFLSADYIDNFKKSISENKNDIDEIKNSGFSSEKSLSIKAPRIKESFLRLECGFEWEKELLPNSTNITICGRVKHISVDKEFAISDVLKRYSRDSFVFHLMAMKDPYTGERICGGIGEIKVVKETEL
ncbi:MAG: flavin reductase [Actinomycetia bacterium]|nr:flavin reductase [Actinomycetes bacterium]